MILEVRTTQEQQFLEITGDIQRVLGAEGVQEGFVLVYGPHPTAGIKINENGDPDVVRDILHSLNAVFPV